MFRDHETGALSTDSSRAVGSHFVGHDPDYGDELSYSITGGTGANLFTLDVTAADGRVQLMVGPDSDLDFETQNKYTVEITVVDGQKRVRLGGWRVASVDVSNAASTPAG